MTARVQLNDELVWIDIAVVGDARCAWETNLASFSWG
jgi:hypothetical protein